MPITKNRWCGAIALAALLAIAGNAWGFGIKAGIGNWDHASSWSAVDHEFDGRGWSEDSFSNRWPENFEPGHSGRFGGGVMDGDSDSGSNWNSGGFGRDRWRECLLHDCIVGPGSAEWIELMRQIWEWKREFLTEWIEFHRDHHGKPSPVPLPASVLFLGSGLAGLAGFVRRSRKIAARG